MTCRFLVKLSFLFLTAICALVLFNIYILQGGLRINKTKEIPGRPSFSATTAYAINQPKPTANLKIKGFTVKSKNHDLFFRKDELLEFKCILKNESPEELKNFHSIIRTHEKEVTNLATESIAAGGEIELTGTTTANKTGLLYSACRADIDNQIAEADESDNANFEAIYVLGNR